MIIVLSTAHHRYTHRALLSVGSASVRTWAYEQVMRYRALPRATYLFTDIDRLGYWELELAARLYRQLRRAGCRALNDPAVIPGRTALLRRLHACGRNSFCAWPVLELPDQLPFPVFLRTESAHRGVLGDLLPDRPSLNKAIAAALAEGLPARELTVIEYRAQAVRDGLFHKRAMYRIGDRMVPALGVFESRWCVKYGELGVAGESLYDAERQDLLRLSYADDVLRAFDLANIAYGRADYAIVDGRVEVYEINTNPMVPATTEHPVAARRLAGELARQRLQTAIAELDTTTQGPPIELDDAVIARQRQIDRWILGSRWRP